MKKIIVLLVSCLTLLHCEKEKGLFNIESEPLSLDASLKVSAWIGYKDFSYELKNVTEHYIENKSIRNNGKLLSASQAVLYSMPNDMRNEIMTEKVTQLVENTKVLYSQLQDKSDADISTGLQKIIDSYAALNKEINYYTDN